MNGSSPSTNDRSGHLAKMMTVMRREYFSRIKTKGFIIGTVLMPVFIIAMTVLPALLAMKGSDTRRTIAVVDETEKLFDKLESILDDSTDEGERLYNLVAVSAKDGDDKKELTRRVESGELDYYIILPKDIYEDNRAEVYGKIVSNFQENREIRSAIRRAVTDDRFAQRGFDPDSVRSLMASVELATFKIGGGGEEQEEEGFTIAIAWVLVFFLYMTMIIYGNIMMRSVLEEKTSRVVESVISSIKPFYLMAGKIIGVGAVGLTQFLIWTLVAGLASLYGATLVGLFSGGAAAGVEIPSIPISILFYFVIFFLLGYFLYATLYAGVGSIVNSDQEAQQMAMPVTMFLIVPMMIMWYVISNPDSQASLILSLIPFFAPMLMFVRVVVQTPPIIEILAAIVILCLTILLNIWLVGKIFRVGVLMYGKRPTLPEIIKWIRYA